jgi:hypothetical protein
MKTSNTPACLLLGCLLATGCSAPQAKVASPSERAASEADYERLKGLTGSWYLVGGERLGKKVEANLEEPFLTYAVSSGGHSVVEKLFVDKPTEMISIYYLDMGRLNMDHYCSLGNQPRMVAVPGSDELISFQLVAISDMPDENDLHISSHALEFKGPDDLTVYWGATEDRKSFDGSVYHVRRLARP